MPKKAGPSSEVHLRRFCPSCGRNTEDLFEGLCRDCFLKDTELARGPKRIEFGICYDCGRARFNKFWRAYDSRNALIRDVIARNIKPRHGAKISSHYSDFIIKGKTEVTVDIDASLSLGGKELGKKYCTTLVIFPEICPECSRLRGGYYEAVMQLRGDKREKMQEFVQENIKKYAAKWPNSFITKVEKLKEGTDLYMGSQHSARKLGAEIRKLYNVQCLITKKIHGMKNGKEIVRFTIFLG